MKNKTFIILIHVTNKNRFYDTLRQRAEYSIYQLLSAHLKLFSEPFSFIFIWTKENSDFVVHDQ